MAGISIPPIKGEGLCEHPHFTPAPSMGRVGVGVTPASTRSKTALIAWLDEQSSFRGAVAVSRRRRLLMPIVAGGSASGPPKADPTGSAAPVARPASIGRKGFGFQQFRALGPG